MKNNADNKDSLLKYIPFALTIATIIIGLIQYKLTSEKEIRKEFFYKQVQSYEKIMDCVSDLINYNGSDKDSIEKRFDEFRKLRYGSYLLYATDTVNFYVITFDYYYDRYINNDSVTRTNVQNIAYKLFNSCRYSLNQTLGVELKDLSFREPLK